MTEEICGVIEFVNDKPCLRKPGHGGRHTPSRRAAREIADLETVIDDLREEIRKYYRRPR